MYVREDGHWHSVGKDTHINFEVQEVINNFILHCNVA
jgi:hypothetical protein